MRKRVVERVQKELDPILDAQVGLATGLQMVMVREWETNKKGEQHRTGKWVQVTEPQELLDLMNGSNTGDEYYQIWTKTPDVNAGKNLLDQTIGKARESVDLAVTGNLSLTELFNKSRGTK